MDESTYSPILIGSLGAVGIGVLLFSMRVQTITLILTTSIFGSLLAFLVSNHSPSFFPDNNPIVSCSAYGILLSFYNAFQIYIFTIVTTGDGGGFEGSNFFTWGLAFILSFVIWFILFKFVEFEEDSFLWHTVSKLREAKKESIVVRCLKVYIIENLDGEVIGRLDSFLTSRLGWVLVSCIPFPLIFIILFHLPNTFSFTCNDCSRIAPALVILGQSSLSAFCFILGKIRLLPDNSLSGEEEIDYLRFHSKRWWQLIIGVSFVIPVIVGLVPIFTNIFDGNYLGRLFPLIADFSAGFLIGVAVVLAKQTKIEKRIGHILESTKKDGKLVKH